MGHAYLFKLYFLLYCMIIDHTVKTCVTFA